MVRLGAMGDVIHTLPAAADLRRQFPHALIAWAVDSKWSELLRNNPHVDKVIPVPMGRWRNSGRPVRSFRELARLVTELRDFRFDLAIDFQGLVKSALVSMLSGASSVSGFAARQLREPAAGLAYSRFRTVSAIHVVDRYRRLAQLGSHVPAAQPALFPLPAGDSTLPLPERFVLASPQAGWGAKQWPAGHYSELAARIWNGHGIPLLGDCPPGLEVCVRAIRREAPHGAVQLHASTLSQLIAATRRATAVVGVDSGPLHMAAALGKTGVAIFGPTDPRRNGPYGSAISVLRKPGTATTYKRTPQPSASMRFWSPERVYAELRPMLS